MTKHTLTFVTVLIASFATACGNSPLFNHQKALAFNQNVDGSTEERAPATDESRECTLAFPTQGLCASLTWETSIVDDVVNTFTLRFWETSSNSYRDVDGIVAVQLWMPSMGHGSAAVTVTAQGNGVYSATGVQFIMPGDWDIRVQIKKNGRIVEQAILPIRI